jgi:hypothetical protein
MKLNRVMVLPVVAMMVGALAVAGCSKADDATNEDESAAVQPSDSADQGEAQATTADVGTTTYAVHRGGFGRGGRGGRAERGHFGRGERGRGGRGERGRGGRSWWRFW